MEENTLYTAILDSIPDIAWLKDEQGEFLSVNEPFGRACGFKPKDLIGKTDLDIWPKELAESYRADDLEVMSSKKRKYVQEKLSDKEGKTRWIEIIKTPVFDGKGKVVGTVGIARDITERKENDERSKDTLTELEIEQRKAAQIKERFLSKQIEFILGATKTSLDIIDQNFYIRYIDSEWAKKYGDFQGKKCFDYFLNRKSPCPQCALKKAFVTKQMSVSYKVLVKENNRPIQVTSIPFQDESGEWLVTEINVDMTEKKKIDDELSRYRIHLEDEVAKRTKELIQEVALHKKAEVEKSKLNRDLLKFNQKLKNASLIDAQTGLYNHHYLYDVIESEFHQARRYAQSLSVIMIDIDYFKSINDVYGVTFGDLVLKQFAKQLKRMVRRYDMLIRYSGEEFVIVSPRLSRDAVLNMAQRLLEALNFINFGNKLHTVKLKLSLAAVSFPEDRANKGVELINLANTVLNKAKESGGNRAYSTQDIKKQPKRIMDKSLKNDEVKSLRNTIEKLNKKSKQGLVESIFAFAKTIELKDHYTGKHVENTVHYATEIAKMLDLPRENIELIKQAAMLHDLGKIGISEHILLKKGKLNKKEFAEIKKHPQIGADIIRPIQFLHNLVPFIFYHHERWDGKGYPSGIKGEDIPVGARIIAIADVYQALISDRPYHKAFSKKKAIGIIKKSSGTQFDPRIVNIFFEVLRQEK